MQKTDSIKELALALSSFQAEQKTIKHNATNPFLKNKYADLTALIESTKANLHKNGLAVSQLLGDGVTTVLMHKSGEWIASTYQIEPTESKGTNSAQQMGIAITYARRYAYASILGLVTDEDTDGATETSFNKPETNPKPKPQKTTDFISEAQLKRLYTIVSEIGITGERAKEIIGKFGYESSKHIRKIDYEEIVLSIEKERKSK